MKIFRSVTVALCAMAVWSHTILASEPSVGLVLSGGGAKGIAHVGVIQALEDNNVPIDFVTGTSMGAIVGGLYACGYSPAQMMELFTSAKFLNASTGQIAPDLAYFFSKPPESPRMVSFPLSHDEKAKRVPQSIISPLTMDYEFMEIFARYDAVCGGDFNRLMVPFRCVASNSVTKSGQVMSSGSVGQAIRASMTFPIVFSPIAINDTLMYDGGIYDNFPVNVMLTDFNPDFMVGVDVHTPKDDPAQTMLYQIDNLVTRPQSYTMPADRGVRIHIDLSEFNLLDFPKARQIYEIGYQQGLAMVDSIRAQCGGAVRTPEQVAARRAEFNSRLPRLRFGSVSVTGGTEEQNRYVERMFGRPESGTYSLRRVRDGFFRAVTTGEFANVYPTSKYNPATGLYDLSLKIYPKAAWTAGIGGFITSSSTSMLYADIDYNSLGNTPVDASLGGWIGQNYAAARLLATLRLGTESHPYAVQAEMVVENRRYNQTDQMFYRKLTPDFVDHFEAFGRIYPFKLALGRHAAASLSAGYGILRDRCHDASGNRHVSRRSLGQVAVRYEFSILNSKSFPTEGMDIKATGMWLPGRYKVDTDIKWHNDSHFQIHASYVQYFPLGKHFAFGVNADGILSTRSLMKDYYAAITSAAAFSPAPAAENSFNSAFRANSYLAAGVQPIWKIMSKLQLRGYLDIFLPWQQIINNFGYADYSAGHFIKPQFFGEAALVYDFPFAALSIYGNYRTGPDHGWNAGVTFGLYITAPKFLN